MNIINLSLNPAFEKAKIDVDAQGMFELTKSNYDVIDAVLKAKNTYVKTRENGDKIDDAENYFQVLMERHPVPEGSPLLPQFTEKEWQDLVVAINSANSTRSSKEACEIMGAYLKEKCGDFTSDLVNPSALYVDKFREDFYDREKEKGIKGTALRQERSLTSKIFRYLEEWVYHGSYYAIYDNVVRALLPYYLARQNVPFKDYKSFLKDNYRESHAFFLKSDMEYTDFYKLWETVLKTFSGLNSHQLDRILWYGYKNDAIRMAVAPYLAYALCKDPRKKTPRD